jgi:hypothetical protein
MDHGGDTCARLRKMALEEPVRAYLERHGDSPTHVRLHLDGPFATGFSSRGLERLSVAALSSSGTSFERSLLVEHTDPAEAEALRALSPLVPTVAELPELIAEGEDETGHWVVIPQYEGRHPPSRHAVPAEVFPALAHVHSYWQGKTAELIGIVPSTCRGGAISAWATRHRSSHAATGRARALQHGRPSRLSPKRSTISGSHERSRSSRARCFTATCTTATSS